MQIGELNSFDFSWISNDFTVLLLRLNKQIWLKLLVDKLFRITFRFNFSNVDISASIYPPLKQNPPL
jgi:hypothetical protein